MSHKRRTKLFFYYMLLPSIALGLSLFFADNELFLPASEMTAGDAVQILNDPKLDRSLKNIYSEKKQKENIPKNEAVDRIGIIFRFTMLDEVKKLFEIPLSFAGNEQVRKKPYEVLLSINNNQSFQALIHVHGHSTARGKRKSFNLNIGAFKRITDKIYAKKMILLNMADDPYGFEFKFAYDLLSELGLFLCYTQYAVVYINDEAQGLYLLAERPVDAIRRQNPQVVSVFRKGVSEKLEPCYIAPSVDPWELISDYNESLQITEKKKQAEKLNQYLDLESYFKWLAFNSLVKNGDTVDELFLYEVRDAKQKTGRLRVMPWDYDDLQSETAHNEKMFKNELFWGAGQKIDGQILTNPMLYQEYRLVLQALLENDLDENKLVEKIDQVKRIVDDIDTGFPPDKQLEIRMERNKAVSKFKRQLLLRRVKLLDVLAKKTIIPAG